MANTELKQLSIDLNKGKPQANFSIEEGNEMIRGAMLEICGGKFDRYAVRDNMGGLFRLISEIMTPGLGELLVGKFDDFAEVREVELGDSLEFNIQNNSLFKVSSIAAGNRDIRRQRIFDKKLKVETEKLAIKIYEELDRFIAGRIDWIELTNRVQTSFQVKISTMIYNAIYDSYTDLEAPYKVNGSFDEEALLATIAHVEASTGQEAAVYGTKTALAKITLDPTVMSDGMKDNLNLLGHIGQFRGTDLFTLPQAHKNGTNDFLVSDDFLLVVPAGEKIVKVVLEGDVVVDDRGDGSANARNDEQLEFFMARNVGVGVLKADRYAIYRLDEESTTKAKMSDLVAAVESSAKSEDKTDLGE